MVFNLSLVNYLCFRPILRPTGVQALINVGTASGVEEQVTGTKIASSPAFTPVLSASTKLQPLPQPPLQQTFQEPEFKELDDRDGYYNFTNVLQVLDSIEIDENVGQHRNVKGNLRKI